VRRPRRVVSVGHSYIVRLNRRLAHEMARVGTGRWEVTAVAPTLFSGDFSQIALKRHEDDVCALEGVPAHITSQVHVMIYGRRLRDVLQQQWDLVHSWEEPFVLAGGQIANWTSRGTPLVFYTFQNISKAYPIPFSWVERYSLRRCAGWLAAGVSVAEALIPRGYDRRPHRVIPLGVDLEHFRPDSNAGRNVRRFLNWDELGSPVFGYLGRFVPEKGLRTLTDALDTISTPWRALFVGAGPLERDLRKWSDKYGDRVRVVTGVTHDQVPAYLNAMDVLCAPSRTTGSWREQLGRMLIEAFACGVPVVASNSGEIPHVVGQAGLVVDENDHGGWARTLTELSGDLPRRTELRRMGLERARSEYAWPLVARKHLAFFEELLDSSVRAAV
jgi:glycosyltransferase involved in cell wall biosynthesis